MKPIDILYFFVPAWLALVILLGLALRWMEKGADGESVDTDDE